MAKVIGLFSFRDVIRKRILSIVFGLLLLMC